MISASMEGILIIMAGAIIIYEGADRLFFPSQLSRLDIGIYITAAAGLVNYLLVHGASEPDVNTSPRHLLQEVNTCSPTPTRR